MYLKVNIKILLYSIYLLFIFSLLFPNESKKHAKSNSEDSLRTFHIVSHGWHTGIIININDLPDSLWPIEIDFSNDIYLEVGWGDKDFYMSDDANYFTAFKAAIWPTKSVLHIVGFYLPVKRYFNSSEIIQLKVIRANYQQMCDFILSSFETDRSGKAIPLGRGLYGNSQFFLGKKKYYYPQTCNVWTASAVYKAGIHIYPKRYQLAEDLMDYLKEIGEEINIPEK